MKRLLFFILVLISCLQIIAQNNDIDYFKIAYSYLEKGEVENAFFFFLKSAKQGVPEAQYNVGIAYATGEGVKQDSRKAFEWFLKAAENGIGEAQNNVGYNYLFGKGVAKDYDKAKYWIEQAIANLGRHPVLLSNLGVLFALRDNNFNKALHYSDLAIQSEIFDELRIDYKTTIYGDRGYILFLKNDLTNAEKMLSKCIELNPNYLEEDSEFAKIMLKTQEGKNNVDSNNDVINVISGSVTNKNTFALIIGNEIYKNEVEVSFANNDSKIFCQYVEKTLGVPHDQIKYIENAGYNDIRIAINWLTQAMKVCRGKGKAIVYYAGHGIPNESDMSPYLLPVDGIGNDPASAYSLKELYDKLGSVEAQSVTIFLDACFSGSKRDDGMLTSARGVALKAKAGIPKGNMVVFSAAQGDETAYPYKDKQHGMFTYYLLKKLQETKGDVTLGELSEYLKDEVGRQSFIKNNKIQTPTVSVAPSLKESWRQLKLK